MNRKVDALGRIVIPADIRDMLNLVPGQEMGFGVAPQSRIITLTPLDEYCRLCGASGKLRHVHHWAICEDCLAIAMQQPPDEK